MQAQATTIRPTASTGRWTHVQKDSHLPDTQDLIRSAIRRGMIRVVPDAGDRVRIIPSPQEVDTGRN